MGGSQSTRFEGLLDAEARHRADPHSFSIPRSEVRRALAVGDLVKLLFGFGGGEVPAAERMWVEVVEVREDGYVGRLENTPEAITDLRRGDLIRFQASHVAATYRVVEDGPTPDQLAIVSDRVWHSGAVPTRAVRMPVPDEQFSGWLVSGEDDPDVPPADLSGFGPVSHDALTRRFRSLDSIEDEPHGTRWRWNDAELEWQPDHADGGGPSRA